MKNLGNVAGVVRSPEPPLEADGLTEKRYVLWAKEIRTSPISYQLLYFSLEKNEWTPLAGISDRDLDFLKYQIFGTADDIDLNEVIGFTNILAAIKALQEVNPEMDNRVMSVGEVYASADRVNLLLHESGFNSVRFDGFTYSKTEPEEFPITPVTTGVKDVFLYATPDPQLFHIAEGAEGAEAVEPDLPVGAIIVKRILITPSGQFVDGEEQFSFRTKSEQAWRRVIVASAPAVINFGGSDASTVELLSVTEPANPTVGGIRSKFGKNLYDGKIIWFKNSLGVPVTLTPTVFAPQAGVTNMTFDESYVVLPNAVSMCRIDGDIITQIFCTPEPLEIDFT